MNFAAIVTACVAVLSCSSAEPPFAGLWNTATDVRLASRPTEPHASFVPEPQVTASTAWSVFNRLRGDHYALDDVARRVESKKHVKCDPSGFQLYKGRVLPYAGAVTVDPAFVERLVRFEAVVNQVALEVYGRTPNRLVHAGAFSCRTSRNRASRLSEHALGNALDVVGFSFPRATKAELEQTPTSPRGPFKVTVFQHWNAERTEQARMHRDFLRKLASAVVQADVFRVALGPSHPGHADHLHFDMSPWNYVHL